MPSRVYNQAFPLPRYVLLLHYSAHVQIGTALIITKLTVFSLNFENAFVFSEFNDFASTYVFKTRTNKFMTLNVNELSSIMMLTLKLMEDNTMTLLQSSMQLFVLGE